MSFYSNNSSYIIYSKFKINSPRNSLGFFIGKNNFADMKKNVSL